MHRDGDETDNVVDPPDHRVLPSRARRAGLRDVSRPALAVTTVDQLECVFLDRMDHLYRFLRSRTGDGTVAEDLAQQVFVKALLGHPSFRGDDDALVSWLFRIARNESATWSRGRSARCRQRRSDSAGSPGTTTGEPDRAPSRMGWSGGWSWGVYVGSFSSGR